MNGPEAKMRVYWNESYTDIVGSLGICRIEKKKLGSPDQRLTFQDERKTRALPLETRFNAIAVGSDAYASSINLLLIARNVARPMSSMTPAANEEEYSSYSRRPK
jgi:hypothetical protein